MMVMLELIPIIQDSKAWRSGKILDIHGGAGNVTGELHIGANRGDGRQSVGSINFYDNTQDSSP